MKTPRPYQQKAIEYGAQHNMYLCDDCGLGKTFQAISTLMHTGTSYRHNLVICRKSARTQWEQEIHDSIPDANVTITNHLHYDFRRFPGWYILHYDEMVPKSLLYSVARVVWDGIILDEAHAIKNRNTQRSKNIVNIVGARKIALSATPIEKNGGELWPVLKWLDSEAFPAYWTWVGRMFEVQPGYYGGFDIGDPIDMKEYQAEISPYIIKRTKQQVAPDLPELVKIEMPVEMSDAEYLAYEELRKSKDVIVQIQDVQLMIENALALHTRMHQLSVLPSLIGLGMESSKMVWLQDFIEDHPNMRLLIFSSYRGVVETVRHKFKTLVCMRGMDESERFKKGDNRLLAGTIAYMSESLSFEMADAAIFLDQMWSATQMKQASERHHRMNITEPKLVYYLKSSRTDEYVMDVVNEKYDDQQMLLNFLHGK